MNSASGVLADSLARNHGGFDAGVALRWPRATAPFGVQAELLVVTRARSFNDDSGGRRSLEVRYAQFPLLMRASLRRSGRLRLYALAGPYLASRMSAGIRSSVYLRDDPVDPRDVRAIDAGLTLGFGSDVTSSLGRASFELRVGLSATDMLDERAHADGSLRVVTLLLAMAPFEQAD